ncbi:MAG: spermidine/putrescine ABC transporter substrate-binding protein [Chloroflexi bacterium]|nr:spermidine/putrescine ABC transporter substrate-binding protein [Chloroflexota bacterium]MCL5610952.1 spermidine/putrescine ABC transporter substrate-binding protein [Chloroflexota bacterium]
MKKSVFWKLLAVVMVAGFVLAACGGNAPTAAPSSGGNVPTTAPSGGNAPTAAASSGGAGQKVTSSGFVCPEPNPRVNVTSTQLNLFVWTEYIPTDVQECFQLVYGIKVNRDEYSGNEEMYAKLSAGATSYDIVQPTNNFVAPMIRNKMIQKLDKSKLTIMGNFDPKYLGLPYDPNNDYTIPYEAGTDAIVYNSTKITTPPTSWKDLWKPGCASKNMVMLDGAHDIIGATLVSLGYDANSKDPKQLDAAKAKLLELAPCVKSYDSDSPKTALIAGDVDLGITWTGEAFLAQQQVPAIKYVYPTEGAILWQDNYAIPTNAPHLDAAYAWLNYTMQGDLFWMMLRDFPYTNPDKAALDYAKGNQMPVKDSNGNDTTLAKIYDAYMNSPITNTPPDAIKAGHWLDDLGDAAPLYDKIWTEVKGK